MAKTIDGAGGSPAAGACSPRTSRARAGLLQRLDARVKALALFGLLVAIGSSTTSPCCSRLYAATLVLAAASALPLGFFIKRVWLFIPIFTGIVVLPATLNVVTDGDVVVPLGTGSAARPDRTGADAGGVITFRVATSISLVMLLTLTTPWTRLLSALRALGVPRISSLVIGMAYRYIFVLLGAVTDMYMARKARTSHRSTTRAADARSSAPAAGALFGKSH